MSSPKSAFDGSGDFNRSLFFATKYEVFCSTLILEVPLKPTKVNLDKVLLLLNLDKMDFQLAFKNWHTDDASNAELEKDFPDELLFVGLRTSLQR